MATKTISIVITADGRQYAAAIDKATGQLKQMGDEGVRTGRKMSILKADVLSLRNAFAALGVGLAVREVLQAGLAADRMTQSLTAATGSAFNASRELIFLRQEAERIGINFEEAAQGFTRMAAAARGTALEGRGIREVFTAVAEASRVMGLSAADTGGVLRAIEQIISKGTLSAEELRQQLGDRLPGAFQIAARAMGVTTAELSKMVEQGEVVADDFLPRFARELRKSVSGGLEGATESPAASFERLANAMHELKSSIAESGLIDTMAALADKTTLTVRAFIHFGKEVGLLNRNLLEMDLGQTAEEADRLQIALNKLDEGLAREGLSPRVREVLEQQRAELAAQLARTQAREKAMREAQLGDNAAPRPRGGAPGLAGTGGASDAAAAVAKAGDAAFSNLQRELALMNDMRPLAELHFELERGRLKDLAPARKQQLLDLAQEVAARRAHIQALQAAREEAGLRREEEEEAHRAARRAEAEELAAIKRLEDAKREAAARSLDALVRSLDSELQAARRRYDEEQQILIENLELQHITRERFLELGQQLEQRHRETVADIHKRETERMARDGEETFRELSQAVKGWGRDFADTLLDNERGFSGFIDSVLREIQRIAITKATDPLFGALEGFLGDAFKGIFSPSTPPIAGADPLALSGNGLVPGFAMGGSFTVGGPPGIDRSLVAFRGTAGEQVTVTRPGQGRDGQSVRVELINRGAPKEAVQSDVRFDARGMIVQVMLDDQRRGGPIISGIQNTLGLRRGG